MALVLAPEAPLDEWFAALDGLLARTPGFFAGRPVVLDLARLPLRKGEIAELLEVLEARQIRIMGIESVSPSELDPGLPPAIAGGRAAGVIEVPDPQAPAPAASAAPPKADASAPAAKPEPRSLLIDTPVRSGQSIIFPEGDVTVVGSVASGAEVIAGGSIHVYGTLRGRAIAGAAGNAGARIFCHKLEAELLAIDGLYKVAEDMDGGLRSRPVQAWLEGDSIIITALN
ncbi:MAG: septum site-determining protein MinC [Pseudomonadota bacterium]|jgi:septum site-determining protein MinC|nr:septum site-determining protein MinC [Pseudomonadota bacterium]